MTTTTEMQLVDINKLIPYVNNARTHSPEQITKLRSLQCTRRTRQACRCKSGGYHRGAVCFCRASDGSSEEGLYHK